MHVQVIYIYISACVSINDPERPDTNTSFTGCLHNGNRRQGNEKKRKTFGVFSILNHFNVSPIPSNLTNLIKCGVFLNGYK